MSDTKQAAPNPYPSSPKEMRALVEYEIANNVWEPFTHSFGAGAGQYPVVPDRYRLVLGLGCPYSHRIDIIYRLLGLDAVISAGYVNDFKTEKGWEFLLDKDGEDPVLHIKTLNEAYAKTVPGYVGRASIPSIIDVPTGKLVTCEDLQLGYDLEVAWKPYHRENAPDLNPEALRGEIDALNKLIEAEITMGAYNVHLSATQEQHDAAFDTFFNRLDELERRLNGKRFLFGDALTDSDIKLFPSLVRFDAVYYHSFHANRNSLQDFPNLWRYARELYAIPAFRQTTSFDAIKRGYYLGNLFDEPKILFKGPDLSHWN
jgi:putative glutathione S-transferase